MALSACFEVLERSSQGKNSSFEIQSREGESLVDLKIEIMKGFEIDISSSFVSFRGVETEIENGRSYLLIERTKSRFAHISIMRNDISTIIQQGPQDTMTLLLNQMLDRNTR